MNKNRLLILADALEADAKKPCGLEFDLESWGNFESGRIGPRRSCGTQACAVGFAALLPKLKKQGLRLRPVVDGMHELVPAYQEWTSWDAVTAFFDLDRQTSLRLFDAEYYDEGEQFGSDAQLAVAKRIRELVEQG